MGGHDITTNILSHCISKEESQQLQKILSKPLGKSLCEDRNKMYEPDIPLELTVPNGIGGMPTPVTVDGKYIKQTGEQPIPGYAAVFAKNDDPDSSKLYLKKITPAR